jgi:DNA-binding PucR family transcriptional regulator
MIVSRPDGAGQRDSCVGWHTDGDPVLRRIVSAAQAVSAGASARPLIGARSGFVVMLWPLGPDVSHRPAEVAHALRRYVASRTGATISTCLADASMTLAQLASAFRLATGALRLIQAGGRSDQLISLDQLGIFRILLAVEDPTALRDYADELLRPLREYDLAHQGELMQTLRGYLDNDLNASRAAAALHIHANTLTYRLRRVEEIAGVRLKSTDDILQLGLALAIDRLGSPTRPS